MSDPAHDDATIPFRDAMAELREILDLLDGDEVDLDALSGLVERAAVLIRTCRERIRDTEMQVSRVLEGLGDAENSDGPDADGT